MNAFLFLLIALGALAIVATLRDLPMDGLRARPADRELLQRLRDREERAARLRSTSPLMLPEPGRVRLEPPDAGTPEPDATGRDRLAADVHLVGSRQRIRAVRARRG